MPPPLERAVRSWLVIVFALLCLLDTFWFSIRPSLDGRASAHKKTGRLLEQNAVFGSEFSGAGLFDEELLHQYASDFGIYAKYQRADRVWGLEKPRYHSLPLVTGDGFRMLADVIFETDHELSESACASVKSASKTGSGVIVVYVDVHIQVKFFQTCFEKINAPIVLVTHNGDPYVPHPDVAHHLDSSKLVHWFGQNCAMSHSKLSCIPIGLENQYLGPGFSKGSHGTLPELLIGMMLTHSLHHPAINALTTKLEHTWAMFDRGTHGVERDPLWELLTRTISHDHVTWIERGGDRMPVNAYWRHLTSMAAMICPRGNGLDTHRAWESLYLGRMTITKHSSLDEQWSNLPVLLLNDWKQLLNESVISEALAQFTLRASSTSCKMALPLSCLPTSDQGNTLPTSAICDPHDYKTPTGSSCLNTNKLFMPFWLCQIGERAGRVAEFCGGRAILAILRQ